MFIAQHAFFLYAVSPVHMGAGTALGLIDNPIQREKHTDHPMVAGSGLKGAVRHRFWAQTEQEEARQKLNRHFGPGPGDKDGDFAGAVSFSDGQLVAFPIRCSKAGFVYATSPLALARAQRLLAAADVAAVASWHIAGPASGHCRFLNPSLLSNNSLQVDTFELEAEQDDGLREIAQWLADKALPDQPGYRFFRDKLKTDLVLMNDEDFGYFVKNATLVEPHVRIDPATGTAQDGGLFYTENLPPESLLISVAMSSDERSKHSDPAGAATILDEVLHGAGKYGGLHGQVLQVGGDATTGRGQVVITVVEGEA